MLLTYNHNYYNEYATIPTTADKQISMIGFRPFFKTFLEPKYISAIAQVSPIVRKSALESNNSPQFFTSICVPVTKIIPIIHGFNPLKTAFTY